MSGSASLTHLLSPFEMGFDHAMPSLVSIALLLGQKSVYVESIKEIQDFCVLIDTLLLHFYLPSTVSLAIPWFQRSDRVQLHVQHLQNHMYLAQCVHYSHSTACRRRLPRPKLLFQSRKAPLFPVR